MKNYRALLRRLQRMTPEQLDQSIVVYDDANAFFPDSEISVKKISSDDLQECQREGIVIERGQIVIHF